MNAFDGCTSLADIYYGGMRGAWDGILYSGSILTLNSGITVHYTDAADINGDGASDLDDVSVIMRCIVVKEKFASEPKMFADINGDGIVPS